MGGRTHRGGRPVDASKFLKGPRGPFKGPRGPSKNFDASTGRPPRCVGIAPARGDRTNQLEAAIAAQYSCSKRTVARSQYAVASIYCSLQKHKFESLSTLFAGRAPGFGQKHCGIMISALKFDETQEQLAVKLNDSMSNDQAASKWHVLVGRRRITLGFVDPEAKRKSAFVSCDWVAPVVPLRSTSASNLFEGLLRSPAAQTFVKAEQYCAKVATVPIFVFECDGAAGNDKCLWYWMGLLPPAALKAVRLCSNHQVHLVEAMLFNLRMDFLARMYSIGKLLRTNGYFLRLIAATPRVVQKKVSVRPACERPLTTNDFNVAVRSFAIDNFSHSRLSQAEQVRRLRDGSTDLTRRCQIKAAFVAQWDGICELLPSDWAGDLLHFCDGCPDDKGVRSESGCHKNIGKRCTDVFFKAIPSIPEAGKWAKAMAMLVWLVLGLCCGRLLTSVWVEAFLPFKASAKDKKSKRPASTLVAQGEPEKDPDWEVDWRGVFSKRVKLAEAFLMSSTNQAMLVMYVVVLEPIKWLTDYFLSCASRLRNPCKFPVLMDLLNPKFSPVLHVLQWFSTLLGGSHSRCRLVYGFVGCSSAGEFVIRYPELATFFRRLVLAASGGVFRRFELSLSRRPWVLAGVADVRRPLRDRREICADFVSKSACCLDWGFSRVLRQRYALVSIEVFMSPLWQEVLVAWAEHVSMTIADCEFMHARNRRRAARSVNRNMTWESFAAAHVNEEATFNHNARRVFEQLVEVSRGSKPALTSTATESQLAASSSSASIREPSRGWRGLDFYRDDMIQEAKQKGTKRNFCTKKSWDEIKEGYSQLDDDKRLHYESLGEASFGAARSKRHDARRELRRKAQNSRVGPLPLGVPEPVHAEAPPTELALARLHSACPSCSSQPNQHTPVVMSPLALERQPAEQLSLLNGPGAAHEQPLPVDVVEQLFASNARQRFITEFKKVVGRPCLDRGAVPDKVERHPHCGSLCSRRASKEVLTMHKALVEQVCSYFAQLPEPAKLPNHDVVLAFVSTYGGTVTKVEFVSVVEGVLQSGQFPARQSYVVLKHNWPPSRLAREVTSYAGLVLSLPRKPLVSQTVTSHFECTAGSLLFIGVDDLAKQAVTQKGNIKVASDRVDVHRLYTVIQDDMDWLVTRSEKLLEVKNDLGDDIDEAFIRAASMSSTGMDLDPALEFATGDVCDWVVADLESILDTGSSELAEVLSELNRGGDGVEGESDTGSEASDGDGRGVEGREPHEEPSSASGSGASPVGHCDWATCTRDLYHVFGKEVVLSALRLRCTDAWEIEPITGGLPLGKLYMSWGSTMSANCHAHVACKCLVRLDRSTPEQVESDLIKWLAVGQTCDKESHQDHAAQIKMKNGMAARPPK